MHPLVALLLVARILRGKGVSKDEQLAYATSYILVCTTKSVSSYYRVPVCATEYHFVLQSTSLYYRVPVCITEYQFVLQNTSLYYRVPVCTAEYQFVLQSTSFTLQSYRKQSLE